MILIFGENQNDSRALRELVMGLCPEANGRVQVRREPPSLQRDAGPKATRTRAERVAAVVRAERHPVTCVLVHSDADGPDADGRIEAERTGALTAAGVACGRPLRSAAPASSRSRLGRALHSFVSELLSGNAANGWAGGLSNRRRGGRTRNSARTVIPPRLG